MKRILSTLLAAALTLALFTGCSQSEGKVEINVYNWGEYIDEDLLDAFEQETGIAVNYTTFNSNEEMYAKLKAGGTSYDVVIPSDYMVSRMIAEDMVEELNLDNIPNAENLMDNMSGLAYDPVGVYSVPYAWGTVGIIYDKTAVTDPVDTWDILWNETYAGQILMFNNPRDAIAIALFRLGYDVNTTDEAELRAAAEELKQQKGVVQAYVMDAVFDKMENSEALLAPYYAGDYLTMLESNEDLGFSIPKEGSNVFVDAMCIPKGSAYKAEAEKFINFMCQADVALQNMEYTGYSTPLQSVYDMLNEEIRDDGISYPPDDVLAHCETFYNLPQETLDLYDALWVEIFK